MITLQHTEECLSLAFVYALAGRAGVSLAAQRVHDYGIDGTFRSVKIIGKRRVETGYAVDFQMKATTTWEHKGSDVVYDLEVKNYNDMVQRDGEATPCILILLCLPSDHHEWIEADENRLVLQRCCYWMQLEGDPSSNSYTQRIFIPRKNALTPQAIASIMANEQKRRVGI
ncbi:DUF4365 domain-containing protein [Bradyrhizobium sp. BRP19]|uniref:DUF4365 domain-containing protein n=1 Tax=Bradyrhizobium sp. BRP19 TaxID=2793823 RepID=UPI001CD5623B|nr:DUF4365 domain-containing protein [Bradyrhizobium sp. BRP19]MCA1547412.1 DUF4365 domain-containing protein [Bradyrhizobium sp. BRP19]